MLPSYSIPNIVPYFYPCSFPSIVRACSFSEFFPSSFELDCIKCMQKQERRKDSHLPRFLFPLSLSLSKNCALQFREKRWSRKGGKRERTVSIPSLSLPLSHPHFVASHFSFISYLFEDGEWSKSYATYDACVWTFTWEMNGHNILFFSFFSSFQIIII